MAAILPEADEIIVKPFEARRLVEFLHQKISTRKPLSSGQGTSGYNLAALGQRCRRGLGWQGSKTAKYSAPFLLAMKSALDIFRS
jgi:hypothetical protein